MNWKCCSRFLLVIIVSCGAASVCYAGSERFIMTMTTERMEKDNLVFARFFGANGEVLESDVLKQLVIREQDCASGALLTLTKEYKLGYAPKSRLVGVYLYPQAWQGKSLCFEVPGLGKVEKLFNPMENKGNIFELKIVP